MINDTFLRVVVDIKYGEESRITRIQTYNIIPHHDVHIILGVEG
jgi:hypothetical protein